MTARAIVLLGLASALFALPSHAGFGMVASEAALHAEEPPRRAILLSIDALNEGIARRYLAPEEAPSLFRVFEEGACAAEAVTAFPSSTAPGHAVLWTGTYGNVNGVTGNSLHALPPSEHTVLEMTRGYDYATLSADPIWLAAGRAGIPVAGHHPTQAPFAPGYPTLPEGDPTRAERRAEAERILAEPFVNVLNGYNRQVEPHRVLGSDDVRWTEPDGWEGLDVLGSRVSPLTFDWDTPVGRLYGVFHGGAEYTAVTVARSPDARQGVTAHLRPTEFEPATDRALARHFSLPLEIPVDGGRVYLHLRLFELAEDGSSFLLYYPGFEVVEGNREDLTRDYDRAVGGWIGSAATSLYLDGHLGSPLTEGGDGTAEARYLETAELLTRQFMRGSEWLWREKGPRLLVDYFPLGDQIDHALIGHLDPASPAHDPAVAARVREFRARAWSLIDLRLGRLLELAEEAGGALFLTGDHGMRPSWNLFRPNVALREAGLLAVDADGEIDLSRTQAVSPNGYWISVNRTSWRGGIVPPDREAGVLAAARATVEGVRGVDGRPVVTRTFTPDENPGLGIGGAAGGDLYWGTAPGYRSSGTLRGPDAAGPASVAAGHGFPPDEPDMFTAFCGIGAGLAPEAGVGRVRTSSIAPSVADYAGIPHPLDATGRSVLDRLLD